MRGPLHSLTVLLVAVFSVTAVCSCADIRVEGPRTPIVVVPVIQAQTKGASGGPLLGTEFPDNRVMSVSAYYTAQERGIGTGNLFTDVTFTRYGYPAAWRGGTQASPNEKYWPIQGSLSFLVMTKGNTAEGSTLGGTVSHPASSGANVAHLRYAMPDNSEIQDDVMFASSDAIDCESHQPVSMVFKHAQANITVSVDCAIDEENYGISVKRICLRRAVFSGTVDVFPVEGGDVSISWPLLGERQESVLFGYYSGLGKKISSVSSVFGKGIVVPGQSPTGEEGDVDIFIEYTLHNGLKADNMTPDNAYLTYVYTVPAVTWEPGRKYNYVFSFSMNEIVCQVSVSEWEDGGQEPIVF